MAADMKKIPVIGITMGDPAGIGPEIILKTFRKREILRCCIPVIIGDAGFLKKTAEYLGIPALSSKIDVIDLKNIQEKIDIGKPSRAGGIAAVGYIKKAVNLAKDKKVDAIATAPISKEAINMAGYKYPGHTEMLAEFTDTKDYAMMIASKDIRVVLITTHAAIKDVNRLINREKILRIIRLTCSSLKLWGFSNPRIGVSALNPHAGEGGIFGSEEIEMIAPAIDDAKSEGIDVCGPFPADTIFVPPRRIKFDAIVVMYHDQGLIPVKMTAFGKAVNITLGLPFIRVSVDHGTAYDIAGKGVANPSSLIEAVKMAVRLSYKCI